MPTPRMLGNTRIYTQVKRIMAGGGSASGNPRRTILVDHTVTANSGLSTTPLITYTVPANTLLNNGDALYVRTQFTTAANVNNKSVATFFGATGASLGPAAINAGTLNIEGWIVRISNTSQLCSWRVWTKDFSPSVYTQNVGAETLSSPVNLVMFGTSGTGSNDVFSRLMTVEFIPAGSYV